MYLLFLQASLVGVWIIPIIQGFVEINKLAVHSSNPPDVLQSLQGTGGGAVRRRRDSRGRENHSEDKRKSDECVDFGNGKDKSPCEQDKVCYSCVYVRTCMFPRIGSKLPASFISHFHTVCD